ncbi:hypothetical protein KKF81_05280 [Candidatus Micrarchaeota archaeon]|nr:hypothetical protein [Candidatus Micrarchaeota archaeon]MBU1166339.1 hypothetical protein [Candidatus Micrarchaeota archaeon]MBU1886409.1 hypothetical protein [Candidatus Micrarchaeota archaeon]
MTEIKRTLRCSNCGVESSIHIASDLEMNELVLAGKCNSCGSSIQINYNLVHKLSSASSSSVDSSSQSSSSSDSLVNLDESIFGQEMPSDTLKDIMED